MLLRVKETGIISKWTLTEYFKHEKCINVCPEYKVSCDSEYKVII